MYDDPTTAAFYAANATLIDRIRLDFDDFDLLDRDYAALIRLEDEALDAIERGDADALRRIAAAVEKIEDRSPCAYVGGP